MCLVQAIWDSGNESCRSNLSLHESLNSPLLPPPRSNSPNLHFGLTLTRTILLLRGGGTQPPLIVNASLDFPAQSHCLPLEIKCHPWTTSVPYSLVLLLPEPGLFSSLHCTKCQVLSTLSSRGKQKLSAPFKKSF